MIGLLLTQSLFTVSKVIRLLLRSNVIRLLVRVKGYQVVQQILCLCRGSNAWLYSKYFVYAVDLMFGCTTHTLLCCGYNVWLYNTYFVYAVDIMFGCTTHTLFMLWI